MWDPGEYERAAALTVARVGDYVARSQAGEGPVVSAPPLEELMEEELGLRRLVREGGLDVERFGPWLDALLARDDQTISALLDAIERCAAELTTPA